jgi:pyruvate/2-oxoglutarate dehydrogenase complex dihydrolipoamide dehydrogenase (E3) component
VIQARLLSEGIDVRLDSNVVAVASTPAPTDRGGQPRGALRLSTETGALIEAEALVVAVGRKPDTSSLALTSAGVAVDSRGYVRTDAYLATNIAGVYAVGDVTGRLAFTHAADEMGRVAVANAFGRRKRRFDISAIPWVTFTDPEVAHVGMSESEAARYGGRVAYVPMSEVDRAITSGRTDGFVKLVAGPRKLLGSKGGGRLLGATIVAPRAGEMIHEAALAIQTGMFAGRLAQTVHAYPTWSTAIRMAAAQFFGEIGGRTARPASSTPGPSGPSRRWRG